MQQSHLQIPQYECCGKEDWTETGRKLLSFPQFKQPGISSLDQAVLCEQYSNFEDRVEVSQKLSLVFQ